ncbi:MAG: hypothetical protein PVI07_01650 [Anaerolineae bacterium]
MHLHTGSSWSTRQHCLTESQVVAFLLCATLLLNACTPTPTPTVVSPSPTAVPPTPSITPTPSPPPTPAPSATPTPAPTFDPQAVADRIAAGQVALEAQGVDPLCLRWEDTDGDGQAEWAGLYLRPTDRPRLEAFVLDGETWHELRALENEEYGLGMYPACELDVQDINGDGRVEVLIQGHAEENTDLLHIFVWDDLRYDLLAAFQGDAGIEVDDRDGKLGKEVIVRYDAGKGLAWEAIHTWDGANYGWTWERYDWLHSDYPHTYLTDDPEHVVISFYLALDDRDLPSAYSLLSSDARSSQPYQTWAAGFDTTLAVEVGSVHQIAQTGDSATVTAQVRSYDNLDGYVVGRLWDTTWSVRYGDQFWRLQSATSEVLDRWEAPYFP